MTKLNSIKDRYYDWLNLDSINFFGLLIRTLSIVPGIFMVVMLKLVVGTIKGLQWINRPYKEREPTYTDDDYLVQDWRGMVMTQEEHRRQWGFPGYPTTHDIFCTCEHCTTAALNFAESGGYFNVRHQPGVTRRIAYDYLNDRPQFEFIQDFSPKKKIKAHKLVERNYTMRRPGVYTREVDYSTTVYIPNREQFTEIFGQP